MADSRFSAGLDDQDELSQIPSAANPLTWLNIDPDMARANPGLLDALRPQAPSSPTPAPSTGPLKMPEDQPVDSSVAAAGALGGAGETPANTATPSTPNDYAMAGLASLTKTPTLRPKPRGRFPPVIHRLTS